MARLSREERELLKEERAARRKKIIKNILISLAVVALVAGFIGFSQVFCTLSELAIEGVVNSNPLDVQNAVIDGRFKDNAMFIFLDLKVEKPARPEFVKDIKVKMTGLHSIEADVSEKELYLVFKDADGNYVYSDSDGNLSQVSERFIPGLIMVNGLEMEEDAKYDYSKSVPVPYRELKLLLDSISAVEKHDLHIKEAWFDDKNYLSLYFKNCDYDIVIGNDTFLYDKISRLEYILPTINGMSGTLHLENFSLDSKDIVFEKDEAQIAKEKGVTENTETPVQ